jgi:ribonucleotide reductase beta subunit family protein with ferritin-like domain
MKRIYYSANWMKPWITMMLQCTNFWNPTNIQLGTRRTKREICGEKHRSTFKLEMESFIIPKSLQAPNAKQSESGSMCHVVSRRQRENLEILP